MTNSLLQRATLLTLTVLSTTALVACSSAGSKDSVTVIGPWLGTDQGTEGYAFRKVLDKFTEETGIQVNYQGARALSQVLWAGLQGGTPPDVAILATAGEFAQHAQNNELRSLDDVLDAAQQQANDGPWLLKLTVAGKQHIYTVPVKANLKSLVWYPDPARHPQEMPRTWDALMKYSRSKAHSEGAAWCMGMGDGAGSGWPGTDMIEDIFLHKFGPYLYRKWSAGTLPWTAPEVREAWTTWGQIASNVYGGPRTVLLTDFADAGRPMFADPPGCSLEHQASFIMGFYSNEKYKDVRGHRLRPGVDYNFFPFPEFGNSGAAGTWEVSVDMAGMFTDTPQARKLMHFLATTESQGIWPAIPGGSGFTVNKDVELSVYPDDVSKRIARIYKSAARLCLDASDLMPATMRNAFGRAILEYLSNPKQLGSLLQKLDQVRATVPKDLWVDFPCR